MGKLLAIGLILALSAIVRPVEARPTSVWELRVGWHVAANARLDIPIHAQFRPHTPNGYQYDLNGTLDATGWITFTGMEMGDATHFDVWWKGARELAVADYDTSNVGGEHWIGVNYVSTTNLGVGDCDDNDIIGAVDYSIMHANYGLGCSSPGYDQRSDTNYDCITNLRDYNYIHTNFGYQGEPPFFTEAK